MRTLVVPALLGLLAGCSDGGPTAPPDDELAAAPSSVIVAGTTIDLKVDLWRDFMPSSPPNGRPLAAVLQLRTRDGSAVPEGLRVEATYVVLGSAIWATERLEVHDWPPENMLEVVARGGPKWGPGVSVDVVVRIRYEGASQLIAARNQPIERTD